MRLSLESFALFLTATIYGEIVAGWFAGRNPELKTLAINTAKRLPGVAVAWAITKVAQVLSAPLTLGVLALILGAFFALVAPLMGAEGAGPIEAIRRSTKFVTSRLGHVLWTFIVTGLGAIVLRLAIRSSPSIILGQFGLSEAIPEWIVSGLFEVASGVIALAFVASASIVLYLDVRVRREGIDLTMAVDELFTSPRIEASGG